MCAYKTRKHNMKQKDACQIVTHGNGTKTFSKISEWHKNLQSPIHTIQYAILMDQNMGNGGDKMPKLKLYNLPLWLTLLWGKWVGHM